MAKQFRVVDPDEAPGEENIVSVYEAGERGSRMDELVQLRRILARSLDDPTTPARDLGPLVNRYTAVSREIHDLRKQVFEEARASDVSDDEEFSVEAV